MKKGLIVLLLTPFFGLSQGQLLFHSGFELGTKDTIQTASSCGIVGVDNSLAPPNDWVNDLWTNLDTFSIQYKGGDSTQRVARVVPGPIDTNNRALMFWFEEPNEPISGGFKGRISGNFYNIDNGLDNVYYSVKMFIPDDFEILTDTIATWTWLTTMEFWNDIHLDSDYGFRITINMQKTNPAPDDMYFDVHAQTYDSISGNYIDCPQCWEYHDSTFPIPIEEWFTVEIYFKEGDDNNGRFYFAVTPDGGPKQVLFDVTGFTHHPDDPTPDGLTHFNAVKLYTGGDLIDSLTSWGGRLHVYWDDFEIWKDTAPPTSIIPTDQPLTEVLAYPNPAYDAITVELPSPGEMKELFLFDLHGRLVRQWTSGNVTERINRRELESGVYYLDVRVQDRRIGRAGIVFE